MTAYASCAMWAMIASVRFTENLKFGAEHLKSLKSLDAVVEISDGLKNP